MGNSKRFKSELASVLLNCDFYKLNFFKGVKSNAYNIISTKQVTVMLIYYNLRLCTNTSLNMYSYIKFAEIYCKQCQILLRYIFLNAQKTLNIYISTMETLRGERSMLFESLRIYSNRPKLIRELQLADFIHHIKFWHIDLSRNPT